MPRILKIISHKFTQLFVIKFTLCDIIFLGVHIMTNEKIIKKYLKQSHELAKKHLIERFIFEIQANKQIFKNKDDLTLNNLIEESHNCEIFSTDEYQEIYDICKKYFNE